MLATPMMTASPNDAWLRHILWQTSHHCGTQWSNIIFAKQMHHIAVGDASFDKLDTTLVLPSQRSGHLRFDFARYGCISQKNAGIGRRDGFL
jgi:hypothetical protein